jgi:hypothetical protein
MDMEPSFIILLLVELTLLIVAAGSFALGLFLIIFPKFTRKHLPSKITSGSAYKVLSIGVAALICALALPTSLYFLNPPPAFPIGRRIADPAHDIIRGDCSGRPNSIWCQVIGGSPLDQALNKLIGGNVAFNSPKQMQVGRPQIVEAKLSTKLPPAELKAQLTQAANAESASLTVGDRMSATLNGGAAFDISPSGPQTQWISQNDVTTWTWTVTPKTAGTQYLIITFDAMITVDGKDGTRNVRTLTQTIDVEVGWPQTVGEWFDFGKKWFENAGWVWASVLVPIGVFVGGWWHRMRRRHPPRRTDSRRTRHAG